MLVRPAAGCDSDERATTQTDPFKPTQRADGPLAGFLSGGRRARFSRTDLNMLVARALKISQIADGGIVFR
jgi:hypothetical protein